MDKYISPEIDARFEAHKQGSKLEKSSSSVARSKSIIDLALTAYLKQKGSSDRSEGVDPLFKRVAINQMKLFLFSGHDTTSSTICYVLYVLSVYPHVLSHVRAELDEVLGTDPAQTAAARISEDPFLLNKLPYITATIKEAMRLFPAASTTRRGEPAFTITDPRNGLRYPADPSMLIWLVSHACHHDPNFWPRADEFLPERWLAKEGDELHPTRGAWRPFEYGPRACIGKELSMIELRIVVCLMARNFEIRAVYDELDAEADQRRNGSKVGGNIRVVDGERAYQVGKGEPSGYLPCRVKIL
jgi:cytochrome P450